LTDPTVLIGCNDGGKTTTLDALEYFFGTSTPPPEAYSYVPDVSPDNDGHRPRVDEMVLEAVFSLSEIEREAIAKALLEPPGDSMHVRKVFKRMDASIDFSVLSRVPENPELPSDVTAMSITTIRSLLSKYNIDNPGGNAKEPLQEALHIWLLKQPLQEGWLAAPTVIKELMPIFQIVEGEDPEQTILQLLRVSYKQLQKYPDTEALLNRFRDDFDKQLRQPLVEQTKNIIDYIKDYLPDITKAEVLPEFKVDAGLASAPLTLIGSENARIDISARGAGTRQQVNLAIFEWSAEKPPEGVIPSDTILAFDEPDLHLDYEAQKRIYKAIESHVNKGTQVVVATHSLNFINRVSLECICHYSKPAGQLETTIEYLRPESNDPDESTFFVNHVGESMGFDNAAILYERCFLAFEGNTELATLPLLFSKYTKDSLFRCGIRLVNCYDQYGAIVFAKFMHKNGRRVLFMVDEDTTINKGTKRLLTKNSQDNAGFAINEQVHIIGPDCFEYAFTDQIWAKVLNDNEPNGQKDWSPEKLTPYRQGARSFVPEMLKILQEESKPNVGMMLAKAVENPDDIPDCIRRCFDKAIRLAAS
ncbi:MAG: AAA family ATPase, partial [Petrimonas sp.]|nr:AAA family ATPase [Petrimonas sp.]